jgi:predicted CoA-substrate-specific enzyme activase
MSDTYYLGVDVGSVSTNLVLMDTRDHIVHKLYLYTEGRPILAVCKGIETLDRMLAGTSCRIAGVGATGSGRLLAGAILGADLVKNEISAHAVAAHHTLPGVRTILEIGGQDSKIILMRDGIIHDFAMNTVCAAGTGSFLDRQAARLGIAIGDFGIRALASRSPVRIAGRCAVFAESDMIHKQQNGFAEEDIIAGLCQALVRNYLNNLAKGKELASPVVFQGGVAANAGMVRAFEEELRQTVRVPAHHDVMGAWGAALLAKSVMKNAKAPSRFVGFASVRPDCRTSTIHCNDCPNCCEIVEMRSGDTVLARWGGRCGKWEAQRDTMSSQAVQPIALS